MAGGGAARTGEPSRAPAGKIANPAEPNTNDFKASKPNTTQPTATAPNATEPAANDPNPTDLRAAALDRHRRGVAAGAAGRPAAAAEHFRAGLRLLDVEPSPPPGTEPITARLLTSLAHAEAELGRVERGLELLRQAEPLAEPEYRAVVVSQRALLLWRVGRYQAALPAFDEAVPLLADHPDRMVLARVLLNRGGLRMAAGQITAARADSRRCEQIARECGEPALAAKAVHNRGYCDLLLGNIPAALEAFERAEATYRVHTPGIVPIVEVDRARALLAAGLADEAAAGLESAIAAFRVQRLSQDRAEAELALAQALAAAGKPAEAAIRARQAQQHFRARGNETWAALAELTTARADYAALTTTITPTSPTPLTTPTSSTSPASSASSASPASLASPISPTSPPTAPLSRFATRTTRLAQRLDEIGLPNDAAFARILSARALIRVGKSADQINLLLDRARPRGVAVPLELRLAANLARAELAASRGERAVAFAELRSGLTRLHEQRRTLGSLDLQTGTATLGSELTSTGLRLALDSGSARSIFAWSERSRAQAFRVRPVRPPYDPQTAADLAEFRKLDENLRNAELGGRTDTAARQRHVALRRRLREQSWTTSASHPTSTQTHTPIPPPPATPTSRPDSHGPIAAAPVTLAEIANELTSSGQAMISLLRQDDRLLALVIADGKTTLVSLGGYARATEAAYRLLGDLDVRGGRRLPARLQAVIDQSIRRQLDVLTAEITAALRPLLRDLPVVIVPTGPLAAVPWSLLPDLRGRPVTVCPSAQLWLAAHRSQNVRTRSDSANLRTLSDSAIGDGAASDAGQPDERPILAAGPRLAHAEAEVTAIASLYTHPVVLTGHAATVEATLRAMDGARTVHLAAHGHHERGNVMFARIDLADGPLMAYDLQRLAKPPQRVILSACEVGRSEVRSGDEHLGFTAALLYAGTSTVIASGALVPDTTAAPLMAALHKALAVGAAPAVALAEAMAANQADPFVCYGAG